jgi:hypothetical protein
MKSPSMKMKLVDAIAECERWLEYLEAQRQQSFELQKLARATRAGDITGDEARRRMRALDNSVKVYDGAELAKAVAALIVAVRDKNNS